MEITTLRDASNVSKLLACYACNAVRIKVAFDDSIYRVLRCLNCGLHFVNPAPTVKEPESHLSDIMYNGESKTIEIEKQKVRAMITVGEIIKLFRKGRFYGNRLLDIGCGYGFFLKNLSEYGWEVYGCEQNIKAKRYAEKMGQVVYQDLKDKYLWREDFYDVVTLWNVLEHLDDPLKLLNDCRLLLRKGGSIILRVPNFSSEYFFWNIDKLRGGKRSFISYADIPMHLFCFTVSSLKFILKRAGFTDIHLIPSPLGDKAYSFRERYGPVKAELMTKLVEYLNLAILKLTLFRSPGFLSITMLANRAKD